MIKAAKKYLLAFPKDYLKKVSKVVGKASCFEVSSEWPSNNSLDKEIASNLQSVEYRLASLDFAIGYLGPWAAKVPFLQKLKHPRIIVDGKIRAELDTKQRKRLLGNVKRLEEIEKQLSGFSKEERDIEGRLKELENFGDLDFIPQETAHSISLLIAVSNVAVERLTETAKERSWHLRKLSDSASNDFFILIGLLEEKENIQNFLKEIAAEIVQYGLDNPPLQERKRLSARLAEIADKKVNLEREVSAMAADMPKLKIYRDLMAVRKTNLEIQLKSQQNGLLTYLVFWAQEEDFKKLQVKIKKINEKIILTQLSLEDGEEPPLILENHKFMRPFEYVTEIFGMPRVNELDPTPFLAFFFILFFGICLTDAGYGVVLILTTIFALLFLKKSLNDTKLIVLLFYGGITTLIMGVLFGGYFGASVSTLEKYPWLLRLKQLDPIEDTVLFMLLAFALGYLQVFFAQIVKIVSGAKNKNSSMTLSGLAWALFYVALVMAGMAFYWSAFKVFSYIALGVTGIFVIVAESGGVKIFLKPLVGAIKILQGLIGTMSDVLSYSRLVALGLATGVIALIVNQIAVLLGGMVPYVGFLITALIMIGGHIFNLGINALGAFIHSGRLQFVEFFPKFLEGGGKRFRPTRPELKYIEV